MIVVLTAAAVAYVYSNMQPRLYQSQVAMVAKSVPVDNGTLEAIQKQMPSYQQDLMSPPAWQSALDANMIRAVTVEELSSKIKSQAQPNNYDIVMTVDDPDPTRAQLIAGVISQDFVQRQNAETQAVAAGGFRVVWFLPQEASLPDKPYQPRPLLYTGAAALFGLILGLLLAVVLELLDTTLKTAPEVQQWTGLNTLGVIPRR